MYMQLSGVLVPHNKHTSGMAPKEMVQVKKVVIPVSMHIGAPAVPVVKKGDSVCVGTLVAKTGAYVSSQIHSSVSGTVTDVDEILLSNGKKELAVIIESDGKNTLCETITPPVVNSRESLIEAVKQSGVVGLGGAGFPTAVKLNVKEEQQIEELIINGAECEPYITSDSVTMENYSEDIKYAIETIIKYLGVKKVIIGIEKNKPKAIAKMQEIAKGNQSITVKVLPSVYPQGGEKVLIYHTTGKVTPLGKLPIDVGCIVMNSTSVQQIGKFLKTGIPLVTKVVTVDGSAVKEPQNVTVPIGTQLSELFQFCGGFKETPKKVIYGGPMMGIAVRDLEQPITKMTNAVLAFGEKDANNKKVTACINCGRCANVCPFGIDPRKIAKAVKNKDDILIKEVGADLCMLCGCCSYVCPARRPLVENNRLAKDMLTNIWKKEKEENGK